MSKALYTKYRPHKLEDIVGQDYVKTCIKNAVELNKLSHAYLFTGTRGSGKTSLSRILSLIINCENGPSVDYDINSGICSSIINNKCKDVHEFDAATRTSIDDIREIQSIARNHPIQGRKRVFICDEIHSLRGAAANCFLKTLEEPPPCSMFILCTTEPDKILDTIKSRCQVFNLKNLNKKQIQGRLEYICKKENVEFEEEAIEAIAKSARGSMRDAISNLDIIMTECGDSKITKKKAYDYIQNIGQDFFCELLENILSCNYKKTIINIRKCLNEGKEPKDVFNNFLEEIHDMLLAKGLCSHNHLFLEESCKEKWINIYKKIDLDTILLIMKVINSYINVITYSLKPDITLNSCIVEIMREIEKKKLTNNI